MRGKNPEDIVRLRMPKMAIIGLNISILEGFRDDAYAAGEAEKR